MNTEYNPLDSAMDPALEQAMIEIRDDSVDPAVIEAAAARVWANLAAQCHAPLHTCEDFQSLIPDFKAGRLPEARALLVKDHLHECVACRRVYEGRVVAMPAARRSAPRQLRRPLGRRRHRHRRHRAFRLVRRRSVRQPHRTRHRAGGQRHLVRDPPHRNPGAGRGPGSARRRRDPHRQRFQRHAAIADGSIVELRERSEFSTTQAAKDLTIRLGRGSIIVQAAKRSSGHLYVATADCRVAVTGTVFSVTSGREGLARVRHSRRSPRLAGQRKRRSCTPAIRPSPAPTWSPSR